MLVSRQTRLFVTCCAGSSFNKLNEQYRGEVRLRELRLLYNRKRILMWCFTSLRNGKSDPVSFQFYTLKNVAVTSAGSIVQVLTFNEGTAPNDLVLDLIVL